MSTILGNLGTPFLELWRIDGQEVGDTSGGPVTVLALTDHAGNAPDPHAAIRDSSAGRYVFYEIAAIRRIVSEDDVEITNGYLKPDVANQTGLEMTRDAARAIVALILIIARLHSRALRMEAIAIDRGNKLQIAGQEKGRHELQPRDRVTHPVYGLGRVEAIEGTGKNYRAKVSFKFAGEKTFVVCRSPLRPFDGMDEP
jgi:hypothetical protein